MTNPFAGQGSAPLFFSKLSFSSLSASLLTSMLPLGGVTLAGALLSAGLVLVLLSGAFFLRAASRSFSFLAASAFAISISRLIIAAMAFFILASWFRLDFIC